MERVFVTGATGFVGRPVVRALLARGFLVRCLVRPGSEASLRGFEAIDRVPGDVLEPQSLVPSVEGCAAIVHLVGIIREHPARGITFERLHLRASTNMLAVAREAGVKRFVQMSAMGTREGARSRYHQTKWAAEEAVRASGLDWTILRPSIIFGRGDGFVSVLAGLIRRSPLVPVLGKGGNRLQPIAVEHVAEGIARILRTPTAVGATYEAGGPRAYTVDEIIDLIARALHKERVRKVYVPLAPVKAVTRVAQAIPFYPLTMDQLAMLEEDHAADVSRFYGDLGIEPEPFADGLRRMFAQE